MKGLLTMLSLVVLAVPAAAAPSTGMPSALQRMAFRRAAFRMPGSFHWPGHMWIWNGRLDPATLRAQLQDMAAHGALSPMPLPEPPEFRPTNMPTRMEPPYLSPRFFEMIRVAAEESKRLGLRLWLYDEGGWPSGNACGQLVRNHPEFGRQSLSRSETRLSTGQEAAAPADCVAAFVVENDGRRRRLQPCERMHVEEPGVRLLVFSVSRSSWHADLLNPRAVDAFIEMTHERYRQAIGGLFGTAVPAIFTDEPNMGAMPWTEGFAEAFRRDKGYDLVERLPSLYEGESAEDEQTRIDYFDWWSERFAEAYFGRCREWCKGAGIVFSGHLNGEDETLGARKNGFGDAMRMMRRMDIPGVDAIWRQLWPGQRNHHYPKLASSVAHQEGTGWAITESFAVYGSGLTPAQMKWIVDYQFVRGINLLDMIGYPYSTSDWFIGGERPNFHPLNPVWDVLPGFHAYVARLSYLLSLGKPDIHIALHFPIRDIWAGGKEAEAVAAAHDAAAQTLLEHQCDFDLLDDEVIARDGTTVRDGRLHVGPMAYDAVVITRQRWMSHDARRRLEEFARSGGTLLVVDCPAPEAVPAGAIRVGLGGIVRLLHPTLTLVRPCPQLRVCVRRTTSGVVYFLTNEGEDPLDVEAVFPETDSCVQLDLETGDVYRLNPIERTSSGTRLQLSLQPSGSLAVLFGKRIPVRMAEPVPGPELKDLRAGWTIRPTRSFVLTDKDIEVRGCADAKPQEARLGDWRPVLGESFSGDAVYECHFRSSSEEARKAAWLDLGQVLYASRVELNGRDLGVRLWEPWRYAVRGKVKDGENVLRVTVTNTLANQYVHNRVYERWTPAQLGPYHPIALRFEPDSLPSGLFGPVRLLGGVVR